METLHLIPTPEASSTLPADEDLVALFAEAGLTVEPLRTCSDASCPVCFAGLTARAA
jgi:hypothetical protein